MAAFVFGKRYPFAAFGFVVIPAQFRYPEAVVGAENNAAFDSALQLPDIPRPGISDQLTHFGFGDAVKGSAPLVAYVLRR